jgi:hypothetical protein
MSVYTFKGVVIENRNNLEKTPTIRDIQDFEPIVNMLTKRKQNKTDEVFCVLYEGHDIQTKTISNYIRNILS